MKIAKRGYVTIAAIAIIVFGPAILVPQTAVQVPVPGKFFGPVDLSQDSIMKICGTSLSEQAVGFLLQVRSADDAKNVIQELQEEVEPGQGVCLEYSGGGRVVGVAALVAIVPSETNNWIGRGQWGNASLPVLTSAQVLASSDSTPRSLPAVQSFCSICNAR